MSYIEAKEDRIPMKKDCRGFNTYMPPCVLCGQPVKSWSYIRGTKYTCQACKRIKTDAKAIHRLLSEESVHRSA